MPATSNLPQRGSAWADAPGFHIAVPMLLPEESIISTAGGLSSCRLSSSVGARRYEQDVVLGGRVGLSATLGRLGKAVLGQSSQR